MTKIFTEKECAELLKISVKKLQKDRCNRVGIPYVKLGGSVRYREQDIYQFLDNHLIEPTLH